MQTITEQQHYLAKKCGISLSESGELPDFEREVHYSILAKDVKQEINELNNLK